MPYIPQLQLGPGSLPLSQAHLLSLFFATTYVGFLYISKHSRLSFSKPPTSTVSSLENRRTTNATSTSNQSAIDLKPRAKQQNERWRDDEDVIRARLVACAVSTFVCCGTVFGVHYVLLSNLPQYRNREVSDRLLNTLTLTLSRLGLFNTASISRIHPWASLLKSLKPHLITPVLYTGSLYSMYLSGTLPFMYDWSFFCDVQLKFWSWQGIRNYIAAPITEELVFRACVLCVYHLAGLGRNKMIWLTPLFFGLAHVHHGWETFNVYGRNRSAAKRAILASCAQLTYTTLFGAYCTYLFLRTGSLFPPISAHAFCNVMGIPEITEAMNDFPKRKYIIVVAYIAGIYVFATRLGPWTKSDNNVYWT